MSGFTSCCSLDTFLGPSLKGMSCAIRSRQAYHFLTVAFWADVSGGADPLRDFSRAKETCTTLSCEAHSFSAPLTALVRERSHFSHSEHLFWVFLHVVEENKSLFLGLWVPSGIFYNFRCAQKSPIQPLSHLVGISGTIFL